MKEKKKLLQRHEFCTKGKVHIMANFLFWTFRRWEIRSFFDSKSWCKMIFSSAWNSMFFECGKVLVLNFSEIGNTVFFWSKKLMESWYFLGIFELFMIFQDLGNMVFHAVGCPYHKDICPFICSANQWTAFNLIEISIMKELKKRYFK